MRPPFYPVLPGCSVNSLYFTANVGWRNQLFLNVTGRNDWFSTLADNSNSVFYPPVNLSWVFTDTFPKSLPAWFDFGKLRAGWGASSNGTTAYQNLKHVHINEFEVGLNLSFFQSRLNFGMAWYTKKTTDDIVTLSTSSASGYSSYLCRDGGADQPAVGRGCLLVPSIL